MINTTTMLAHIKGSTRNFLYPFREENGGQKVQYEGEISWEVSFTIITYSLHLRFHPTDRFFTSYTEYWKLRQRLVDFDFAYCTMCNSCDFADSNQEDCFGNTAPACGACLWAQGFIQCLSGIMPDIHQVK